MARRVTCPSCGVRQDPERPCCLHMAGKKGGKTTAKVHGREHYEAIGKKGGQASGKRRAA